MKIELKNLMGALILFVLSPVTAFASDEAIAENNHGYVLYRQGDLDGAIESYSKSIEMDPNFAMAYYNRGLAKREKGDLAGEIADYDKALELDPKYALAYYNRGIAREEKGDLDGSIADN